MNNALKSPVRLNKELMKENLTNGFTNSSNTKNLFLCLYKRNEEKSINIR